MFFFSLSFCLKKIIDGHFSYIWLIKIFLFYIDHKSLQKLSVMFVEVIFRPKYYEFFYVSVVPINSNVSFDDLNLINCSIKFNLIFSNQNWLDLRKMGKFWPIFYIVLTEWQFLTKTRYLTIDFWRRLLVVNNFCLMETSGYNGLNSDENFWYFTISF